MSCCYSIGPSKSGTNKQKGIIFFFANRSIYCLTYCIINCFFKNKFIVKTFLSASLIFIDLFKSQCCLFCQRVWRIIKIIILVLLMTFFYHFKLFSGCFFFFIKSCILKFFNLIMCFFNLSVYTFRNMTRTAYYTPLMFP